MAFPLSIGLAGLGALGKLGLGIFQGAAANKIDRENIRPTQEVQSEYYKNLADAEQAARTGLPQQQYNQALQNQQRNFNGFARSLSRSANPSAGLGSALRAANDAALNLDIADANAIQNNRRFLLGQRTALAQQKQAAFDWNKKSNYLAQAAKAQALRGAGGQNLIGSFGDVQQIGNYLGMMDNGSNTQQTLPQALPAPRLGNYSGQFLNSNYLR